MSCRLHHWSAVRALAAIVIALASWVSCCGGLGRVTQAVAGERADPIPHILLAQFHQRERQGGAGMHQRPGMGSSDNDMSLHRGGGDPVTVCAITRGPNCDLKHAIARGLFETGLKPQFPGDVRCPDIDEGYAISYADKRTREVFHGGIDMPASTGTPIVAAAAGTVVGKFLGAESFRGIEIVLRHSPDDSGIPLWIYTQYAHFSEPPKAAVGQRVRMGEVLGPTGNTGIGMTGMQSNRRRPAIHFAVFYSNTDHHSEVRDIVIPENGYWMDPVALYRKKLPLDSESMKALPAAEKQIPISYMLTNGDTFPAGTKIIWPYVCMRR